MNPALKKVATCVGLTAASLTLASPAAGVWWKSASDPLEAIDDGQVLAQTYGNFYNDGFVSAMSTTWQYDAKPSNNNNVRVETDFEFWKESLSSGELMWVHSISKQTPETDTASWEKFARARNLDPDASKVRGGIDICEIRSWAPDDCSPHAWPSFSY